MKIKRYVDYIWEFQQKTKHAKDLVYQNKKKELKELDKETHDILKDFMNTSKRVIKDIPNNKALFKELEDYTNHYREMKQENRHLEVEIKKLEGKN